MVLLLLAACQAFGPFVPFENDASIAYDADADGLGDALFARSSTEYATEYLFLEGTAEGLASEPVVVESGHRHQGMVGAWGDWNDDGHADRATHEGWANVSRNVFVFFGGPEGLDPMPRELRDPVGDEGLEQTYGTHSDSGDLDGDGIDDLVVARPPNALVVHLGGSRGPQEAAEVVWDLEHMPPWFDDLEAAGEGAILSTAQVVPDLDDDGDDELAVTLSWDAGDRVASYLSRGGPQGPEPWTAPEPWVLTGNNLVGLADLDGDGHDDLVRNDIPYESDEIYVSYGTGGAFEPLEAGYGASEAVPLEYADVAVAGDVNADGYEDLLAFYQPLRSGAPDGRLAQVLFGGPEGLVLEEPQDLPLPETVVAYVEEQGPGAYRDVGVHAWGLGDIHGDGYADVVIYGSHSWFVYRGGPGGLGEQPAQHVDHDQLSEWHRAPVPPRAIVATGRPGTGGTGRRARPTRRGSDPWPGRWPGSRRD